jgi:glyoxylase-like metal-dependent hydrolase (beta-lactamase superfamily II)
MSSTYRIHPLLNGAVFSSLKHILLSEAGPLGLPLVERLPAQPETYTFEPMEGQSVGVWVPVVCWLLLGGQEPILVDTGLASCKELQHSLKAHHVDPIPCVQKAEWRLDQQLRKFGLKPQDIQKVILTHLHGDHIGNNEMFTQAIFFVHESEISLCLDPPAWAPAYRSDNAIHLRKVLERVVPLQSEVELFPGIDLVHVGGHSPGSMAVVVETKANKVAIAGDLVHSYENLELDWPIGSFWDLQQVLDGMQDLRNIAEIVLPNHDWGIWMHYPSGAIG